MRHSQTSRNYANAFFAFVTIGLAAACADSTVAPTSEAAFKAPAAFNKTIGVKVFRVSGKEGATQRLDKHIINIPGNAVCDPATSTYGPGEWDKPCNVLKGSILITATMFEDMDGRPYVDFQPALRFVPTKAVTLYLRSGRSEQATTWNIEFCNNHGFCYDESKTDASLATFRVGNSAILGRRIKHFSGYSLAAGDLCPGTITMEADGMQMCATDGGGLTRRSGYILASGLADEHESPADTTSSRKKGEQ